MKRILGLVLIISACAVTYYVLNKQDDKKFENSNRVLKVLAWEGYADPIVVKKFKEKYHYDVEVTYVENDDSLWNKINSKNDYDLIAANTAEISRYISANLISPINLSLIPNLIKQDEAFLDLTKINGITKNNVIFAIPYVYSEMGLIYNKKIIKAPPTSMEIMWDKKYKGRVLAFNTYQHNYTLSALVEGKKKPFDLSDLEIKTLAKKLFELKSNVLAFYTTLDEATSIFNENNVAILFGNFGQQQVSDLIKNGADVGYIIPKEGALAWLDCWVIKKSSLNQEMAHKWINFLLEEENSKLLSTSHSLHHTLEDLKKFTSGNKIIWLEPVSNPSLRKSIWDNILKNKEGNK